MDALERPLTDDRKYAMVAVKNKLPADGYRNQGLRGHSPALGT